MAEIPSLFHDWVRSLNYEKGLLFECIERNGGWKTFAVLHKITQNFFIYYKINFFLINCLDVVSLQVGQQLNQKLWIQQLSKIETDFVDFELDNYIGIFFYIIRSRQGKFLFKWNAQFIDIEELRKFKTNIWRFKINNAWK